MPQNAHDAATELLSPLIAEWKVEASFPDAPTGTATFEWTAGGRFVLQRWNGPMPEGMAIVGFSALKRCYLQHYFDSRGVARVYHMSLDGQTWRLWRESADFSPLDFSQRFEGTFSHDRSTIDGRWEISYDGSHWERDFDLTYTRVE